ncbi:hypothetical protein [Stenomitos frigidus]|uniref:hypothetical protein n=1 Tax=Stenomitos frigidus TaxID=1886765 RepID=UPI003299A7CF
MSWGVIPFDLTVPDLIHWLEEEGANVPTSPGRFPTIEELLEALTVFEGEHIYKEHIVDDLWEVTIGKIFSDTYAHMLGRLTEDGCYDFHFWSNVCRNQTMITILKQVSYTCGPLIWWDECFALPLVVTSAIDVNEAISEWLQRWEVAYIKSSLNKKANASS